MKLITRLIIGLIVVGCALNIAAQQPRTSSGTYSTYVGDQLFGVENYSVATSADGSVRSAADVTFGPTKYHANTNLIGNKPARFEMTVEGAPALVVEIADGVVRIKVQGHPDRELNVQPTALLENGCWHQFLFLLQQYDFVKRGQQAFSGFVPAQAVPFGLILQLADSPAFQVGGQQIKMDHFRADTSLGLAFEIWTDAQHVPLVISVPAQQLKVVRKGAEDLAAVIVPPTPAPATPTTSANDAFTSEEVTFQNSDVKLVGTLTIPKSGAAPFPAVVIITGSGSQDRDGSTLANIYKLVAERLSEHGVAVLRADDRGAGKSSIPMKATSYRDLINDSKAAFEFLYSRKEIDRKRIALAGHSEGAETALTIAAEDPRVAAIMLLAGASRSVDRVLIEQTLYSLALHAPVNPGDKKRYPAIVTRLDQLFQDAKTKPKPADSANDQLAWYREHGESDPLALARRIHIPVLILNGERDDNVLFYHALELAQTISGNGNKQVLVRIFPNLTHLFTPSRLDKTVTDAQAGEVSNDFLQLIQQWAVSVLVGGNDGGAVP